jgi:hypothetical protein
MHTDWVGFLYSAMQKTNFGSNASKDIIPRNGRFEATNFGMFAVQQGETQNWLNGASFWLDEKKWAHQV